MLQDIVLYLARSPEFPQGSPERGYEIVAPIDAAGHLDAKEWRKLKTKCRVRRFSPSEGERQGMLHHIPRGAGGAWRIEYDGQPEGYGEKGVHFDTHRFAEGEYVSLRDVDGHLNTFKIARMRPAGQLAAETASA